MDSARRAGGGGGPTGDLGVNAAQARGEVGRDVGLRTRLPILLLRGARPFAMLRTKASPTVIGEAPVDGANPKPYQ